MEHCICFYGQLQGPEWESFALAHEISKGDTIIFNIDSELRLIAMVFGLDGCERV